MSETQTSQIHVLVTRKYLRALDTYMVKAGMDGSVTPVRGGFDVYMYATDAQARDLRNLGFKVES